MLPTILLVVALICFVLAFFTVGTSRRLRFEWLACAFIVAFFLVGKV